MNGSRRELPDIAPTRRPDQPFMPYAALRRLIGRERANYAFDNQLRFRAGHLLALPLRGVFRRSLAGSLVYCGSLRRIL